MILSFFFSLISSYSIGIDLGTTFSVVAVHNDQNEVEIIPDDADRRTTPSVVSYYKGSRVVMNWFLQRRNRDCGKKQFMTLFDPIWIRKYLTLTISLVIAISDPKSIHLGALGTHFLEHFFGMIKRFCDGNNSASSFGKAVENILIYKIIQNSKISGLDLQPGRSDSGARLPKETNEIVEILKKVGFILNYQFDQHIYESVERIIDETKDDPLNYILYSYTAKKKL